MVLFYNHASLLWQYFGDTPMACHESHVTFVPLKKNTVQLTNKEICLKQVIYKLAMLQSIASVPTIVFSPAKFISNSLLQVLLDPSLSHRRP